MKKKLKKDFFDNYFSLLYENLINISEVELLKAINLIKKVPKKNKIIIIGNGGSAAMASHVAVDFTKVAKIRATNFNEPDLITCFANDYGYNNVFEKAIELYSLRGDLLIAISSSGKSQNIIKAVKRAKKMKLKVITFSGFSSNNPLSKEGNINFWVNSKAYNIVEMAHHTLLLAIVDYIVGKIYYKSS